MNYVYQVIHLTPPDSWCYAVLFKKKIQYCHFKQQAGLYILVDVYATEHISRKPKITV